jgi:hypothetical protein
MFYVAAKDGFLLIKNTSAGPKKTTWVVDVREAQPFPDFEAADTEARGRIQGHYVVLGISHVPMQPVTDQLQRNHNEFC